MEEKEEKSAVKATDLIATFNKSFYKMSYTIHPQGIPGEAQGKSSNESWAAKQASKDYSDEAMKRNVILTTMDGKNAPTTTSLNRADGMAQRTRISPRGILPRLRARIWSIPRPAKPPCTFRHSSSTGTCTTCHSRFEQQTSCGLEQASPACTAARRSAFQLPCTRFP